MRGAAMIRDVITQQDILFYKGEALWNVSHFGISQSNLSEALDSLKID